MLTHFLSLFLFCFSVAWQTGEPITGDVPPLPLATPQSVGMDGKKLVQIDQKIEESIKKGELPGAVVLVMRQGKIVYRKAYGLKSKLPESLAMLINSLFDLASLTKPIATATSTMILLEQGKLRLSDEVSKYLPEFASERKYKITIEQLLLHTSGMIPDNSLKDYQDGRKKALENLFKLKPIVEPDSQFKYSDVNYILLGQIVEKVSGEPLDVFAKKNIFAPLKMNETTFKPGKELAVRAAPTEQRNGHWMQGEVHDPRAYLLGGVAGHAGLFSTADDLAIYVQMLLNSGEYNGKRILSPTTVKLMTTSKTVPGGLRTLGWDAKTSYSSNRGELFPVGGFGHTGFTGTSIWVDPGSETAVILLSNRVHPNGKGNVIKLRSQVATLVAASIVAPPFPGGKSPKKVGSNKISPVQTGIDVLKRDQFQPLKGKSVGLVTNHTGVDRDGNSTIDLLFQAPGVKLMALFSPEHGIRGKEDKLIADSKDEITGLPIYSLYGKNKRPLPEQLKDIDVLVYDIQDIGCRFYTYISTLGYLLETAAEHKKKVYVLDRPNPIGGVAVEGPILEKKFESFVGYHPLPVRHGLTLGELALLFNKERKINADLEAIRMEGWKRDHCYDQTGLRWINPSPNMRSLTEAFLYPGIGLLETTNLSVGRGTDRPFEMIGAPWLDGKRLAKALTEHGLPGVRFVPVQFTPKSSIYASKKCDGIHIIIDDWDSFSPLQTGITIACELQKLHGSKWEGKKYLRLLGNQPTLNAILQGETSAKIQQSWQPEIEQFLAIRKKYLLYD